MKAESALNLLVFAESPYPGPRLDHWCVLGERLSQQGGSLRLLAPPNPHWRNDLESRFRAANVDFREVASPQRLTDDAWHSLFDGRSLVEVESPLFAPKVLEIALAAHCPFVTRYNRFHPMTNAGEVEELQALVAGDHVLVPSQAMTDHIRYYFEIPSVNLIRSPLYLDLTYFDRDRLPQSAWTQPFKVIAPAAQNPWGGSEVILTALSLLREFKPQHKMQVLFFPFSPRRDYRETQHKKLEKRLSLEPFIVWLPALFGLPEVRREAWHRADLVLFASLVPEAESPELMEALAMQKLVIAPDHGIFAELIEHGENGFLFPPGDAGALVELLTESQSLSPDEASRMETRAIEGLLTHLGKAMGGDKPYQRYRPLDALIETYQGLCMN